MSTMTAYHLDFKDNFTTINPYAIIESVDVLRAIIDNTSIESNIQWEKHKMNYFKQPAIILCTTIECSGSVTHTLREAYIQNNVLQINITRNVPSVGTCNMAYWLFVIEIARSSLSQITDCHINIQ